MITEHIKINKIISNIFPAIFPLSFTTFTLVVILLPPYVKLCCWQGGGSGWGLPGSEIQKPDPVPIVEENRGRIRLLEEKPRFDPDLAGSATLAVVIDV